jgi:hypothetical protein
VGVTRKPGAGVSLSIVIGSLLVPFSALASVVLIEAAQSDAATGATFGTTVATQPAPIASPFHESDLRAACGVDGMALVDLETSGGASDVQQAALDALRPICGSAGMPLPEGPVPTSAPEAAVIEVSGTALTQAADDHWDDDDHEGDDDHGDDDDHHDDDSRSHEDEHDD